MVVWCTAIFKPTEDVVMGTAEVLTVTVEGLLLSVTDTAIIATLVGSSDDAAEVKGESTISSKARASTHSKRGLSPLAGTPDNPAAQTDVNGTLRPPPCWKSRPVDPHISAWVAE